MLPRDIKNKVFINLPYEKLISLGNHALLEDIGFWTKKAKLDYVFPEYIFEHDCYELSYYDKLKPYQRYVQYKKRIISEEVMNNLNKLAPHYLLGRSFEFDDGSFYDWHKKVYLIDGIEYSDNAEEEILRNTKLGEKDEELVELLDENTNLEKVHLLYKYRLSYQKNKESPYIEQKISRYSFLHSLVGKEITYNTIFEAA